ncbi:MAG: hypothetical protein WBM69_17725 [Desulfobacterales bacterium]
MNKVVTLSDHRDTAIGEAYGVLIQTVDCCPGRSALFLDKIFQKALKYLKY